MGAQNFTIDSLYGLGLSIADLNDPDVMDGIAGTIGLVNGTIGKFASARAGSLRASGAPGSGTSVADTLRKLVNAKEIELTDYKTLATAAGQTITKFYPSKPDSNNDYAINYVSNGFPYDLVVLEGIKIRLENLDYSANIQSCLLNAGLFIKKGQLDAVDVALDSVVVAQVASSHLNSTDKIYSRQEYFYKFRTPIITDRDTFIAVNINWGSVHSELNAKKVFTRLCGVAQEKIVK